MVTKLRLVFSITILFLTFSGAAQHDYWKSIAPNPVQRQNILQHWKLNKGLIFQLNEQDFLQRLNPAGLRSKRPISVHFPDKDGQLVAYSIEEASVFSKALAQKYPSIRSFKGVAVNDKGKWIRFSISHKGIQATLTSAHNREETVFIQKHQDGSYVLYDRKSHSQKDIAFICKTSAMALEAPPNLTARLVDDQNLRTFRVAISASGEYTQYHGGQKVDALAAINNTITRVNAVFERDLAITLEVIDNTDDVIYLDPETDPYTGGLSTQAQNTFTDVIGEANYDIGHLFNQEDGALDGNAGFIGSVCTDNRKGSAYATLSDPVGDVFDIDLVAHEMGHQFGANHSFSHLSEGTEVQVEPASGTTIMGYAGITGINDVAANSNDYFHYVSILQIRNFLQTVSCGQSTSFINSPPSLAPVADYTIPKATAFALTAQATDPDATDVLTYTWEQIDNGIVTQATFGPNNPAGAMFRSLPPSLSPTRYFPTLNRVLAGTLEQTSPLEGDAWETVSNVERNLNFAVTVRDNAMNGGQSVSDEVQVAVTNDAGPFLVNSQATAITYNAGEVMAVRWDVANTNIAPIGAQEVDILLSLDGGQSFTVPLALNTLNDGSHDVILPGLPTNEARIMIRPSDNIFYAVNAVDFSILESPVVLRFSELDYEVCSPDDVVINFDYETYLGFTDESTLSVENPPPGLSIAFSQDTVSVDTPLTMTLTDVTNLPVGTYTLNVTATSTGFTKQVPIQLNIYDSNFTDVVLTSPEDGFMDASKELLLEWEGSAQNTEYDIEIATDAGFTNIIETATVPTTSYPPNNLENNTAYFWHVKPKNNCGEGVFGSVFSFTTIEFNCKVQGTNVLPVNISASGTPTITSKISFFEDLPVADINVNLAIDHTFLADLVISLTSPAGTTVVLVSSSCSDSRNINAVFDDDALPFSCNGNPAISGIVKPLGSLSSFNGESILGEWVLEVKDNAPSDGGALTTFELEVCVEGAFRPDEDNDGVFDDGDDLCLGTQAGQEVDASGCPVYRFPNENFTVLLESESCRPNDDGKIQIIPKNILDYEVIVTGGGIDVAQSFRDNFTLSNLRAGTYTVCLTATEADIIYEEYCLDVVITQPDVLSVAAKVDLDLNQVALELMGSDIYNVELNGEMIQTSDSLLMLNLKKGINFLKVATNQSCQGVYEEKIIVSESPVVFPNPFFETTQIYLPFMEGKLEISIFSSDGRLVRTESRTLVGNAIPIDFNQLPSGLYYLTFKGELILETVKVIKR
jgi:subtilisin-like proprotein convertase family protein